MRQTNFIFTMARHILALPSIAAPLLGCTFRWFVAVAALCNTVTGLWVRMPGFVDAEIHVTTDNSSYAEVAKATSGIYMGTTGDSVSNSGVAQTIIDVTDTSNVKVKFYVDTLNSTTTVYGSSTATLTGFTFMRLGDT